MKISRILRGCLTVIFLMALTLAILIFVINIFFDGLKNNTNYKEAYLEDTVPLAVDVAKKYDLYPSVMIAQSILESNWGRSELSKEYNNYFGVKDVKGEGVMLETEEYVEGKSGTYLQNFKKYRSKKESFTHYAKLLTEAKRYEKVKTARDFREAARYINEAGYATDPSYADKIISIVEKYSLGQYDSWAFMSFFVEFSILKRNKNYNTIKIVKIRKVGERIEEKDIYRKSSRSKFSE